MTQYCKGSQPDKPICEYEREDHQFLKETDGYVSGEEISRRCGMSRAAIWKYMQELRQDGFDVVAVPHLGYKLVATPDKLLPSEIQHGLKTRYLGKKIIYEDTVSSTMDVAFRLGMEGAVEGTLVCAEGQTKGKGRLGRHWNSPKGKGDLYVGHPKAVVAANGGGPADIAGRGRGL